MSKYTTEVRYICERANNLPESEGYESIDKIIAGAIPKIFDFEFPIFDRDYRNVLCGKILMHYYTQEIGFETVGLWKLKLRTKLWEIMPYYNQLYKSELLEFNPFYDVDLTTKRDGSTENTRSGSNTDNVSRAGTTHDETTSTQDNDVTTTDNGTRSNEHWDLFSDTPQNGLTDVEEMNYLTDARKITDDETRGNTNVVDGTATGSGEADGSFANTENRTITFGEGNLSTEDYLIKVTGKNGGASYSRLLEEFRKTFLNIDMMIIRDLEELFMEVW